MARVRIGSAEIDLTLLTGRFTSGVRTVKKGLTSLRDKLANTQVSARGMATALASIGASGFVAKRIFDIGAAVEETASKFATVFGPAAEEVEGQLANIARLSGLSKEQMQELSATTGQVVQGMGFSQQASAAFAVEIQKLAGDLGSFNNIPVAETSRAIQAALTGEREQLKRLGIVVREVDVQKRAMAISGAENASQITSQARAAATMQIIMERAGRAVGDLERTQFSAAAEARILASELTNLRDDLAVALMPALTNAMRGVFAFTQGMRLAAAQFKINANVIGGFINEHILPFIVGEERAAEAVARSNEKLNEAWLAFDKLQAKIMEGFVPAATNAEDAATNLGDIMAESIAPPQITDRTVELSGGLEHLGVTVVPTVVDGLVALGLVTGQAADEMDRLNAASQKLSSISSGLGFLGRFVGPLAGIAGGFGAISTGFSIGRGIFNAFSGDTASARLDTGGVVVNLNGPGLQQLVDSIEVERGRSRNLRRVERV